jgi:DNA adenine methylase Dam
MIKKYIKSPLNYTGGKYKLLPQIIPLLPKNINTFYDLFVGGANVIVNVEADHYKAFDINKPVIELFKHLKKRELSHLLNEIDEIIEKYKLSNTSLHSYNYYQCNSSNGLSSYNKQYYEFLRSDYNNKEFNGFSPVVFFYVMLVYSFNNQIRFNRHGNFNMPTGKRDFNNNIKNNFIKFVEKIHKMDIEFQAISYNENKVEYINENDVFYADPPYLISTATYNESDGWNEVMEKNLLNYLLEIHEKGGKFALSNVIEHKDMKNEILIEWINKYSFKEHILNFNYNNSSYHAKNKAGKTKEVLIVNY